MRSPLVAGAKWSAVENLVVQHFEVLSMDASAVTRAGTFTRCALVRTLSCQTTASANLGTISSASLMQW